MPVLHGTGFEFKCAFLLPYFLNKVTEFHDENWAIGRVNLYFGLVADGRDSVNAVITFVRVDNARYGKMEEMALSSG